MTEVAFTDAGVTAWELQPVIKKDRMMETPEKGKEAGQGHFEKRCIYGLSQSQEMPETVAASGARSEND